MKKILLINGANLNRMHRRAPAFDDSGTTLDEIVDATRAYARDRGFEIDHFQSNHEGAIVDKLQEADGSYDGVIINPGPFTQYSHAIRVTLGSLPMPTVEVHLVNIFRTGEQSIPGRNVTCVICGLGKDCYLLGVDAIWHALANI